MPRFRLARAPIKLANVVTSIADIIILHPSLSLLGGDESERFRGVPFSVVQKIEAQLEREVS